MKFTLNDQVLSRLEQLFNEVAQANIIDYQDRLQTFKEFCEQTPVTANCLAQLPDTAIDIFDTNWIKLADTWPSGEEGYAVRWAAIQQMVADPRGAEKAEGPIASKLGHLKRKVGELLPEITRLFVHPIYDYLTDQIRASSAMHYLLLRYKRWAEWFEAGRLRHFYGKAGRDGENFLDEDLRRFLFESGIDYPFSQPASPGGKVDIIAGLETDDPLVLEVKIWNSSKKYGEDRVRDGLRQVMDYADKYGKDLGYVAVFNLDQEPLEFESLDHSDEWPVRLEHGGKTYYFIAVNIAEQTKPVSQRSKGQAVKTNVVKLDELLK